MTAKTKLIAAATLALIISVVLGKLFVFTEARKVHRTMLALQEKISAPADGGGLDLAWYGAALKPFFAPEVSVTINGGGDHWVFERDELLRVMVSVKHQNPALTAAFAFTRKDITVSASAATVSALVTVKNLNEPVEPQRLLIILYQGGDKKWRVATVKNPPDNKQPKDPDDETEH
ncbi:MAG: hypothetical protein LBK60_08620 [Verrucomicrobiales bacterium]|jgi:hypothetical protein|nr:hypothetical protein [Verrucomicrobiales bacterium]